MLKHIFILMILSCGSKDKTKMNQEQLMNLDHDGDQISTFDEIKEKSNPNMSNLPNFNLDKINLNFLHFNLEMELSPSITKHAILNKVKTSNSDIIEGTLIPSYQSLKNQDYYLLLEYLNQSKEATDEANRLKIEIDDNRLKHSLEDKYKIIITHLKSRQKYKVDDFLQSNKLKLDLSLDYFHRLKMQSISKDNKNLSKITKKINIVTDKFYKQYYINQNSSPDFIYDAHGISPDNISNNINDYKSWLNLQHANSEFFNEQTFVLMSSSDFDNVEIQDGPIKKSLRSSSIKIDLPLPEIYKFIDLNIENSKYIGKIFKKNGEHVFNTRQRYLLLKHPCSYQYQEIKKTEEINSFEMIHFSRQLKINGISYNSNKAQLPIQYIRNEQNKIVTLRLYPSNSSNHLEIFASDEKFNLGYLDPSCWKLNEISPLFNIRILPLFPKEIMEVNFSAR